MKYHNTGIEVCIQVYVALFLSKLIYGCNVWGMTLANEENTKKNNYE